MLYQSSRLACHCASQHRKCVNCHPKDNLRLKRKLISSHKTAPLRYSGRPAKTKGTQGANYRIAYFSATLAGTRSGTAPPSGFSQQGPGHLANLELVAGECRSARPGLRPGVPGLRTRHESGHHWRQPSLPVLGHAGRAMPGRRAGTAVSGRTGGGHGPRAQ